MSNSKRIKKRAYRIAINEKYRLILPEIERIKEYYRIRGIEPDTMLFYGKRLKI